MANLYITVGIPGCGKSTWAEYYLAGSGRTAIVSSDDIRLELSHHYDQTRNAEVFDTFHARIRDYLAHDVDVVADATHLTRRSRDATAMCARKQDKVHVVFFKNSLQALMRNQQRGTPENGLVPSDVMMYKMLPRYEETCRDLVQEKYDSVTEIRGVR